MASKCLALRSPNFVFAIAFASYPDLARCSPRVSSRRAILISLWSSSPGAPVTYLDMARMEAELSEILGRKADLRTPQELSRYFRDAVVRDAVPQYERT